MALNQSAGICCKCSNISAYLIRMPFITEIKGHVLGLFIEESRGYGREYGVCERCFSEAFTALMDHYGITEADLEEQQKEDAEKNRAYFEELEKQFKVDRFIKRNK